MCHELNRPKRPARTNRGTVMNRPLLRKEDYNFDANDDHPELELSNTFNHDFVPEIDEKSRPIESARGMQMKKNF